MAKIAKILVTENKETFELYPVTSVKAVYDENDERLDSLLDKKVDIIHNGTFTVTKAYQAVFSVPFGTRAVFVVNQGGQSDLETLTLNAVSSTYSTLYTTNKDTLFYMDIWGVSGKCVVYMKNNGGVENSINLYYLSCAADKANWSPTGSYTDESNLAKAVTYWDTSISEKFATYTYTSSDSSLTINRSTTSANFMVNFAGDAFKNAVETNVNTVIGMTDTQVVNENLEPEAEVQVFGNTVPLGVVTKKSGTETVYTSAPEYKIYTHELPQNSDVYSHWYRMNSPMSGQMKVDITANINGGKVQGSIECCFRNGDWLMYASNATIAKYTRWTNTNGSMAMFIANYYYKTDYSLRVHRYDQTIREFFTDDFMPILATASEIEALQEMICLKEAAIDTTKWITISSDNYSATQAFVKSNPNYILAQSTKYSFTDALTDSFVMQFVTQVEGATISIYDKDGNLKTTSPQMSKTSEYILNYNVTDDTFTWSEEAMSVAPVTVSLNEGTQYGSDVFGNVDVTVPGAIVNIVNKKLDTDKVCVSDKFGNIVVSTITVDELKSLSGVITNLQEQIDAIKEFQNGSNNATYNYYCDGTITFDDDTTGTGYVYSNRGIKTISSDSTKVIIYSGYIIDSLSLNSPLLNYLSIYDGYVKTETPKQFYNAFKSLPLITADLSGLDFLNISGLGNFISNIASLTSIKLHRPDFSNCFDFNYMFSNDLNLTELYLDTFKISPNELNNVSGVYDEIALNGLCYNDVRLKNVQISNLYSDVDVALYRDIKLNLNSAFTSCSSLESVSLFNLSIQNLIYSKIGDTSCACISSFSNVFNGCRSLKKVYIKGCQIGEAYPSDDVFPAIIPIDLSTLFFGCSSLTSVLVLPSDFNSSYSEKYSYFLISGYVSNMQYMFKNCSSLKQINLVLKTGFYLTTQSVTNGYFKEICDGCTSLESVEITYQYNASESGYSFRNPITLSFSKTILPNVAYFSLHFPIDSNGLSLQFTTFFNIDISCFTGLNYESIHRLLSDLKTVFTMKNQIDPIYTLTISYATSCLIKSTEDEKICEYLKTHGWNIEVI